MTHRLQNMMLAMLLALTTLFVGIGALSQNPTSGGYQLFERAASSISADIQLASLQNFAPSLETASEYANAPNRTGFDDLAQFRDELGLPPAGSATDRSTLAVVEVNGQQIYGINGHGQPVTGVNAISRTHAEIDALNQIQQRGIDVSGQDLTLYVDRTPCTACNQNGGIRSMVEQLGLNQLTVIGPDGPLIIRPR